MATSDDSGSYIGTADTAQPEDGDLAVKGAAEIRQVKTQMKNTGPNWTGPITASHTELNYNDINTLGTAQASKVLTVSASSAVNASIVTWSNLGTVTTVDINGGTIDGAVIGGSSKAAGGFSTLTLASGATVTAILDEDAMGSNSASALATQQSIKAYVDAAVAAVPSPITVETVTFTAGGANNFATSTADSASHSLGAAPDMLFSYLVCTATDLGYAVGDKVLVNDGKIDSNGFGLTVWASASQFGVNVESTGIQILHKTTGASNQNIDFSKWDLVIGGVLYA